MGTASRGKRERRREASAGPGALAVGSAATRPFAAPPGGVAVAVPQARGADAAAGVAIARPARRDAEPWYVEEGRRGGRLLEAGEVDAATALFEGLLVRLGPAPDYGRAVVLGQLGRCLHLGGRAPVAAARLREALAVTDRLAPGASVMALRGSLWSELGNALRADGRCDDARHAYGAALDLAEALHDFRAQGVDLGHLGALALAEGRPQEACARYAQAVMRFGRAGEPALEAVARHQLGACLEQLGQPAEAARHYGEAARLRESGGDLAAAAHSWSALGRLKERTGDARTAEGAYRQAFEASMKRGDLGATSRELGGLAALLGREAGRVAEARTLALQALALAREHDPAGEPVWRLHGLLADLGDAEAAADGVPDDRRAALRAQASSHRRLARQAPRMLAALARLDAVPSFGRAVVLGGLGRCFAAAGQPELAAAGLQEALECGATLGDGEEAKALRGALHMQLGEVLRMLGRHAEAGRSLDAGLALARDCDDVRAQGLGLCQRGTLALAQGEPQEARACFQAAVGLFRRLRDPALEALAALPTAGPEPAPSLEPESEPAASPEPEPSAEPSSPFGLTVFEEVTVEYVLEPDLLLDGRQERRVTRPADPPGELAAHVRPMLAPGARSVADDDGAVRFCLSPDEPVLERQPGCVVMRRRRREVAVAGRAEAVWRVVRAMDGARTVGAILSRTLPDEREATSRLLASLAAAGVVDVSGRPFGRYLHAATKKGVLPGGRLENDDVLRLATDGRYRRFDGAPTIALSPSVPDRLHAFHALTRARRSRRDYLGSAVRREDFDALLTTACGVTGTLPWAGREVKLRAYPSSGALYAVEIYPIVWRVEGLDPAVYHFRAAENALEIVRPGIDLARMAAAALPVEREMVAGAAAMVCMVGFFPRHEQKYGEGGYRMMVAEAGHLSQNLVLAATALGLGARPFGGVFDDLVNEDLGLDGEQEQFLLAVLVGHTGGAPG